MKRVRLIHWNQEEAHERAAKIEEWGYLVDDVDIRPDSFRSMRKSPPDLVVIDLSRLPSHGRDVGIWVRDTKATRGIPIVFVDGLPEKVDRVKQSLPDGVYVTWRGLKTAIAKNIGKVVRNPIVPAHALSGYSGTPLPKKLGIKANSFLSLIGAPDGFESILQPMPDGVVVKRQTIGRKSKQRPELLIWFPKSHRELEDKIDLVGERFAEKGAVWVAWPKKASGVKTDVTQDHVREIGLAAGLVDYKICSINEVYSGLKFSRRKA